MTGTYRKTSDNVTRLNRNWIHLFPNKIREGNTLIIIENLNPD